MTDEGGDTRPWLLWGSHGLYAGGAVIRLHAGTLRQCRSARSEREREGGWLLGIYQRGDDPYALRLEALAAAVRELIGH